MDKATLDAVYDLVDTLELKYVSKHVFVEILDQVSSLVAQDKIERDKEEEE